MAKINDRKIRETLAFQDLTEEEKAKRHILGRLYGPIADVVNPTRNGRRYSEELWEKVFDNPIMKEKFANKVMYGELGHPEDRTEIDMSKVAVCMPEAPKKDRDGHLIGYFDILDTPNGRILKTLCDYGSTLGISSRGTGDVIEGEEGEEVDPDTYDCECWDVVVVPAVESARLAFTEGLSKKGIPLREALAKQISEASAEDKAIMECSVKALGIEAEEGEAAEKEGEPMEGEPEEAEKEECVKGDAPCADTISRESEEEDGEDGEAADGGAGIQASLKEALRSAMEKDREIKELKERLAVGDAKVSELVAESAKQRNALARVSKIARRAKDAERRVSGLEEQLKRKNERIAFLAKRKAEPAERREGDAEAIRESLAREREGAKALRAEVARLRKGNAELGESLTEAKDASAKEASALRAKAKKSEEMAEGYKSLAGKIADKYIEARSAMLGVNPKDVRRRLPENYGLGDIDRACESLRSYSLRMSKLPFAVGEGSTLAVRESKESARFGLAKKHSPDDEVDEATLSLAGLAN